MFSESLVTTTGAGKECAFEPGAADNDPPKASDDDVQSSASTNVGHFRAEVCCNSSARSESPDSVAEEPFAGFSQAETLLIFDWDDTILPTTWLAEQGLLDGEGDAPSSEQQAAAAARLAQLASEAEKTLQIALSRGTVAVVTNAGEGWVELSCRAFMPSLEPLLQNMEVMSARSSFEEEGQCAPTIWKCRAFAQKIAGFYGQRNWSTRQNVISLGDSMFEREALVWATSRMPDCRAKSLKFMERPSLEHVIEQHRLVAGCLNQVVDYDGRLDYEVDV